MAGDEGAGKVRSAARVLQLLEEVSLRGTISLIHLQGTTGLPKSTIIRLMNTLVAAGYVRQVSRRSGYTLTERVLRLSAGFTHADRVVTAALNHLHLFTATYKWPVGIATFHRGALRLRYGTYSESPIATNIPALDAKIPMLTSAHGHVYFAFCTSIERKLILEMLRKPSHPENERARDLRPIGAMIRNVREKGYSLRSVMPRDRVGGLAVPVFHRGNVVATISMRYFRSALNSQEVVARYLVPLNDLAAEIDATLSKARPARS